MAASLQKDLITHNELIDGQHLRLFSIFDEVAKACDNPSSGTAVGPVLDSLSRYVAEHFEAEEKLMRESNYPEYLNHKKLHDELSQRTYNIGFRTQAGVATNLLELAIFLQQWLKAHILTHDIRMVAWLTQGTTPPKKQT